MGLGAMRGAFGGLIPGGLGGALGAVGPAGLAGGAAGALMAALRRRKPGAGTGAPPLTSPATLGQMYGAANRVRDRMMGAPPMPPGPQTPRYPRF